MPNEMGAKKCVGAFSIVIRPTSGLTRSLDSSRAAQVWGWKPQTPLEAIRTEIAQHAEKNPDWLDATAD